MAKLSKLLLNEAKSRMSDDEFFMSQAMKTHFEKIIEGVCKTFKKRISILVANDDEFVAFTDGKTITVNLNCDWIKNQERRVDKYYIMVGIILHECGHILYTDFPLGVRCQQALIENRLFPKMTCSMELEELFERKKGYKLKNIYAALDNCIEDGHIEKRILRFVPGYGECLMKVRRLQLEDSAQCYEDILNEAKENGTEINRISVLINMVLIYAKYGVDTTYGYKDELTKVFLSMKKSIDVAVGTNNALSRKMAVNRVFDLLIAFIAKELEDDVDEKPDEEGESEDSSSEEGCKESDESKSSKAPASIDEALSELDEICDAMAEKNGHNILESPKEVLEDTADNPGEIGCEEGLDFTPKGTEEKGLDLSYLEDLVAEEACAKELRNKIERKMAKISDEIREERVDKFPSIEKYLEPDEVAEADFKREHLELDRIARRVAKNLDKVIKERQKGDRLRGLYVGKQLDTAHAYRKDKKIFSNKVLPTDAPNMEVCVLVDCSGSMSSGSRMAQSRRCAYVTWRFCQLLGIPCAVYGHTTEYPEEKHVLMQCVAHPDNIDKNDGKRIFMLRPYANNRDGWALHFCAQSLIKSGASSKLLMVISDGLPAAVGYDSYDGKEVCQEVVRRYKKKGISVITAGIDDCAESIKDVYLKDVAPKDAARFLDFSDMESLPKAFATIIKKELL